MYTRWFLRAVISKLVSFNWLKKNAVCAIKRNAVSLLRYIIVSGIYTSLFNPYHHKHTTKQKSQQRNQQAN